MRYLIIVLLIFVSSCVTQRGALGYYAKHPDKFSDACARAYPIKESVRDSVVFIPGKIPDPKIVMVDCDSVVRNTTNVVEHKVYLTVPPSVVHDTLIKMKETLLANTAKEESLSIQLNKEKDERIRSEQDSKTWKKGAFILGIIILLYLAFKIVASKFNLLKRFV